VHIDTVATDHAPFDFKGQKEMGREDFTKIPNGTYYIEVTANPTGLLYESDASNDTQLRMVVLHGRPGHRWVSVPPWEGIDA
jgi:hypothetical protein